MRILIGCARSAAFSALFLLALLLSGNSGLSAAETASTDDVLKAIVKVEASVPTEARTAQTLGTARSGHGVVIGGDGLVLTIGYLILEAESVVVTLHDGKQLPASVVAYDHNSGFGLVRTVQPIGAKPLTLGDSSKLKSETIAIVASYGGSAAAMPVKVADRRDFTGYWEYLLEDAVFTIPPYSSFGGAALLNADGQLVGIGSLIVVDATEPGSYGPGNMFIPINRFKPIRAELLESGRTLKPNHPWIGIYTQETRGRLFIQRVAKGGPAESAGLGRGDIVLRVGDKPVGTQREFYERLWSYGEPGARIPITVLSGNSDLRTVTIR
ncbi:MAG: S1C family serine protease, partial [Pseudomonadota bacterium]